MTLLATYLTCKVITKMTYNVSSGTLNPTVPGCLQLLEILEISWNLKNLLEILEISWNLNGPPGNFCVMIENFILWLMALLHDDVALFVH